MPAQPPVSGLGQFPAVISLSALNGANGFELIGVSAYDIATTFPGERSGYSVSTAGDVNNDGINDIVIGAVFANSYAGKVYVVFGMPSGWSSSISLGTLNGANGFALDGVSPSEYAGSAVSAGDVNNDGIADIIIGANGANFYKVTGKACVVFGKASGWGSSISLSTLNGTDGFVLDGVSASDYSGFSVSAAGDVNNDGIADIIIGAPYASPSGVYESGKTYVVFGKTSGWSSPIFLGTLNGANGFELDGVSASDRSGGSVSAAGDVNNDGIADIIIAGLQSKVKAHVVFGKASGWMSPISLGTLNGTNGFALVGDGYEDSGIDLSSAAGDVNNDGIADIIIGAPDAFRFISGVYISGRTYVVFGKASGWGSSISVSTLNGTDGFVLEDVSGDNKSGYSVSAANDVNNDGIADIIIGAPDANSTAGRTYVVFGKASGWTSPISLSTLNGADGFVLDGVSAGDNSGWSVSTAGDINHDGIADILIGAPFANSQAGKTYVVFGDSPSVLANNSLTIGAGCTITLDSTYLSAYDLNHANSTLIFTATNVSNGNFQKTVGGLVMPLATPIIFSQSDITNGYIQFASTNSNAPSYSIAVSSPGLAFVPATPAIVSFNATCAPTQAPTATPTFAPTAGPTVSPTAAPTAAPTAEPTVSPTAEPTVAPTTAEPTFVPTAQPSFAPSAAPSTRAPSASVVSSATRTSPTWFLPISQAVTLLDSTLPAAYQSVSGYLSGLDASSQPDAHNTSYTSPSLETVGAQLMLGAVALKLAQKGINWAKGLWASKPALNSRVVPALSEAAQSVQTQGSESVSRSAIKDLTADVKHLAEKMESYHACFEESTAPTANVVYPDFQKPNINFAYNTSARKRTPAVAEKAAFANRAQLSTLGR